VILRSAIEQVEDLQPYLDAAQKACEELGRSPLRRVEGAHELLMDPELCADVIQENLCALDCALHAVAETLRTPASNVDIQEKENLRTEVAALREALAPFANRAAEKAKGTKYSVLTDSQWRRALETYQDCVYPVSGGVSEP